MASAVAATIAGTAAVAAYLDARFHIRKDLNKGSISTTPTKVLQWLEEQRKANKLSVYHAIQDWAKQDIPNHQFLEYQGRSWTYKQFYQDVQRVGNWLHNGLGIKPHEIVAISGPNSAEWLLLQYALEGIGACHAFINHNLTDNALSHVVKLAEGRYMLADKETAERLEPCRAEIEQAGIKIVYFDDSLLSDLHDTTPLDPSLTADFQIQDTKYLIYTSGTTGLPKGIMMAAGRHLNTAKSMSAYLRLKPGDRFYTCLPLYHGAAQGLCMTPTIWSGSAVTLGRKFSHKTFWPEVSKSGATHLQYVGELCRYLINAPVHPLEREHQLRMAWGNGMRPDVWEKFRQRFNIPAINELYAATDGLGATFNENFGEFSRNAIDVRGLIWNWNMGNREVHVRIDPDTEDMLRDANGHAIRCDVGEPGEVIHKVEPELKLNAFKGYYKNEAAAEKRWMTNVFEKGDLWFRSGDVHRTDKDGRVYFVDRLGDTFRWRSENVSTNEVADVLGQFEQIAEANVYGVAVPHADGRCGCATVVLKEGLQPESLDCEGLGRFVLDRLPRYATPYFLRVAPQLSYTGTFKIQKGQAKREGVDLDLIEKSGSKDTVFWLPPGDTKYRQYKRDDFEDLKSGKVKL